MLLGPACRPAAPVAPSAADAGATVASVESRLAQVKARTIGIDIHNHVYVAGTEPQHGPPQPAGEVPDLATELRRSGFTAVSAGFVLDFQRNEKPGMRETTSCVGSTRSTSSSPAIRCAAR